MAHPTNQKIDVSKLSTEGRALLESRDQIIENFLAWVKQDIPETQALTEPVLVNSLPSFIDNLAKALSPAYPMNNANDGNTASEEHGSERARLTQMSPDQVIREYQILRSAILSNLRKNEPLGPGTREIIDTSIDDAIRQSMLAYSLVQSQIREQFVASLTHDLRNPINAATMAVNLIMMNPKDPEVPFFASKARDNLRRVDRMIEDLLDVTAINIGNSLHLQMGEVDYKHIVDDVVRDMRLIHGSHINIVAEAIHGFGNADALRRALENLIANAIKYGYQHLPITVCLSTQHQRVTLSVHNSGPTIPAEERETIFQAFRRTHSARTGENKGWGLGLPLVRGVAEAHGGSVTVESTRDRGTTFLIDIPLDARPFVNAPRT